MTEPMLRDGTPLLEGLQGFAETRGNTECAPEWWAHLVAEVQTMQDDIVRMYFLASGALAEARAGDPSASAVADARPVGDAPPATATPPTDMSGGDDVAPTGRKAHAGKGKTGRAGVSGRGDATAGRTHVVMFSSGVTSWATAKRAAERYGADHVVLLFADVKGDNPSPHAGEDPDNYRFLRDAAANIGAPLEVINTGRDIYDVFHDEHMLGNSRVAPCSRELKQKPARAWLDERYFDNPELVTVHVGIDWTEEHRKPAVVESYTPYHVEFLMCEPPLLDKRQVFAWLDAEGVRRPALYDRYPGGGHANCGGFCVRMGQRQAAELWRQDPERFAYHERREQEFRDRFGFDVAFLRHRTADRAGEPMTLRELRERLEAQPSLFDLIPDDSAGCDACFTRIGDAA